ncbi:aspartate/glutamate racemase family protein [Flavobacterium piscisymbiosum]|uniref:Aspartate/glutamate racemase family protein n=1 Tax=Flavobacterium piscisymbiosum TaxID=2893753 RepID=A0ABS8MKZ6_9FLAO|nr:aspartate/glutamate racemase family protein [Flavobacterium sp. F-30]MCC9066164.1 aspartate/glutamate racemase family protein [Flavobacterium sp. F-30]
MKKVGLVGGTSWVSTIDYYKFINEGVNKKLGGLQFAECLIYSLNFGDIQEKTWPNAYELVLNACLSLQKSGVDAIVLCANTAHMHADKIEKEIDVPLIHIGTETAKAITQEKITTVGLLGTSFSMEMDFYKDRLKSFGLNVLIPESQKTRNYIQQVLKQELGKGIINPESKKNYIKIANELIERGAEGIILGCTEIPLLIDQSDFSVPVFDTTKIHSDAIVSFMLAST